MRDPIMLSCFYVAFGNQNQPYCYGAHEMFGMVCSTRYH